jgi:hypothetical protein
MSNVEEVGDREWGSREGKGESMGERGRGMGERGFGWA